MASREKWHITKGIPAALILTLAVAFFTQTIIVTYFATTWKSNVEAQIRAQNTRMASIEGRPDLSVQVARLEENMRYLIDGFKDVKADVKTLVNKKN